MHRDCSLGALLRELGGWQAEVGELFTGWHSPGRTGGICLVGLLSERPQAGQRLPQCFRIASITLFHNPAPAGRALCPVCCRLHSTHK